jgi:hypothetical protein
MRRLVLLGALLSSATRAEEPPEEEPYVHEGLVYRSITAARYNPLGLSSFFRLGYRHAALTGHQPPVLQSTYVQLNGIMTATPAYLRGGARFDIQPLAILNLVLAYEGIQFFGTFDSLQSFSTVNEDFSDAAQSRRTDKGLSRVTNGRLLTINPTFQIRLWKITLVSSAEFVYTDIKVPAGDRFYYDLPYSLLAPRNGWMVGSETDLSFALTRRFNLGLRLAVYHAWYPAEAIAGATARADAITPIVYFGPTAAFKFRAINGASRFKNATVFLILAWWLRNPYRTGQEVSAAIPYPTLVFAFEGEVPKTSLVRP